VWRSVNREGRGFAPFITSRLWLANLTGPALSILCPDSNRAAAQYFVRFMMSPSRARHRWMRDLDAYANCWTRRHDHRRCATPIPRTRRRFGGVQRHAAGILSGWAVSCGSKKAHGNRGPFDRWWAGRVTSWTQAAPYAQRGLRQSFKAAPCVDSSGAGMGGGISSRPCTPGIEYADNANDRRKGLTGCFLRGCWRAKRAADSEPWFERLAEGALGSYLTRFLGRGHCKPSDCNSRVLVPRWLDTNPLIRAAAQQWATGPLTLIEALKPWFQYRQSRIDGGAVGARGLVQRKALPRCGLAPLFAGCATGRAGDIYTYTDADLHSALMGRAVFLRPRPRGFASCCTRGR